MKTTSDSPFLSEKEARKRVRALKEFYGHLTTFIMVNALLVGINLISSPEHLWFLYPLLGWGIGLVAHAVNTFGVAGSSSWEERKVQALTGNAPALEDKVRRTVQGELHQGAEEIARLRRRIEHLEAIVTSRDWDLLETPPRLELDEAAPPEVEALPEAARRTAEIARKVR